MIRFSERVPETIRFERGRLAFLDQRKLPAEVHYWQIDTLDDAIEAIRTLAVRGAPAIGIAAAYALALSVRDVPAERRTAVLHAHAERLKGSRPTAVNLAAAVDRLLAMQTHEPELLLAEAERLHAEDRSMCARIGQFGMPLIRPDANVLTHCNAGALAVSALGTATAPLYLAHRAGRKFHVWVDETRPLLQGARLTAWELATAGIDVTLICDHVPASLMAAGRIDLVIVGTDRVARNGDTANKIGTLGLAVLAQHFKVPFYVACPATTYDPDTPEGSSIIIETRGADEVLGTQAAAVNVYNPAFDVTPVNLITGFITDQGLITAPDQDRLLRTFRRQ
ncbi:MAG: S-methyl-5-thioribose-1-phosphate isomerase [Gammaproteobacteria bacterium]|nr:S-methyl-5-thioribose-1-phosphate isomerase [Gammaproteobacteria bacterium]